MKDRRRAELQKNQTANKNASDVVTLSMLGTGSALLLARNAKNATGEAIFTSACRSSKQTYHGTTHATASEVQDDGPAGPFLGDVDCTTNNDAWFVTMTVKDRRRAKANCLRIVYTYQC